MATTLGGRYLIKNSEKNKGKKNTAHNSRRRKDN
jgi:hypothetical protein